MPRCVTALMLLLAVALAPDLEASGKAGEKATLSFHMETEQNENPKTVFVFPLDGQQRFFRRMPEITTQDVVAFNPFPSDDGATYGILFQLKPAASRRLSALTAANMGRLVAAQANGRIVDLVVIDKQVDDGMIVIWKGITEAEIKLYDKAAPRIGEKKKR
jgi:preprotein translocase subunit SecD